MNVHHFLAARSLRAVSVGLLFVLLGGCGSDDLATVQGLVTLDGQPLAEVEVQFIPDIEQDTVGPPISAYTDQFGRFQTVNDSRGGMVAGTYRVCINDARAMMPGGGMDATSGEPVENGPSRSAPVRVRVPQHYSDVNRTPFRDLRIEPGEQSHNFPLTSLKRTP